MKSILQLALNLQETLNADAIRHNPDIEPDEYEMFSIGPLTPIGPLKPATIINAVKKHTSDMPHSLLEALEQLPHRYHQSYEFDADESLHKLLDKRDFFGGFRWFNYDSTAEFQENLALVNKYNRDFAGHVLIPIIAIGNGDSICLSASDQTVIYYSHDQHSDVIASDVMEYYSAWASVMFIGPEFWLLDRFRKNGRIDKNLPSSKSLVRFFNSLR